MFFFQKRIYISNGAAAYGHFASDWVLEQEDGGVIAESPMPAESIAESPMPTPEAIYIIAYAFYSRSSGS